MIKVRIFLSVICLLVFSSCANPQTVSDTQTKTDPDVEAPTVSNTREEQVDSTDQEQPETTIFDGQMPGGHFQMMLTQEDEKLTGKYLLTGSSTETVTEFKLTGKIDDEGNIILTETNLQGVKTDEISGAWHTYRDDDNYISYITMESPTKHDTYGSPIRAQEQKIFFTGGAKFVRRHFNRNFGKFLSTSGDYPQLSGVPNAEKFNSAVKSILERERNNFRKDHEKGVEKDQLYSYLWIGYNIEQADENIISIGFLASTMTEGAAHSNQYNFTLNYDLKHGRIIELADLFKPKSNYLQRISDYCNKRLNDRGARGLEAKAKHYRAWSLTPQGLLIKFDPYLVDAYAGGTHKVMIPFSELKGLLQKNSPAKFMID